MHSTEQMKGLSVYDHGVSVHESYKALIDALNTRSPDIIDPIILAIYDKLKDKILPKEIIEKYHVFHDCGKPYCKIVDDEGRSHFPDHANVSFEVAQYIFPSENIVHDLIKHDMDFHTLKGDDLEKVFTLDIAATLYFTAWAEIISNSKMFGGFDSTSFKIKKKKLVQAGKKYFKFLEN